jgi:hypothetical protein
MADVPDRYQGKFSVQFEHPLLVCCAIDYSPVTGNGPSFRQEFMITPDGVLATLRSPDAAAFGVTWPLLENDGAPLRMRISGHMATTAYQDDSDQQCYLSLDTEPVTADAAGHVQSTYGWLVPVRAPAAGGISRTFVYPRNPGDPDAEQVRKSFHFIPNGFDSAVGSVRGTLYVGRYSAGGQGSSIDCTGSGKPDVVFDKSCRFILQLDHGKIVSVEADRQVRARIGGREIALVAYKPVRL